MAPRKGRAAVAHPTPGAHKAVSPLPPVACKPGLAAVPAGGDVYTVDGVLTDGECRLLIQAAEALGFAHQGSRGPAAGEAVRDNGRLALADARWAAGLWRVLRPAVVGALPQADAELAVGLYDHIRVYRYAPGQVFGRHYDDAIAVGPGLRTRFTLLVYLSAVEAGGETVFYGSKGRVLASVTPAPGRALLHRHGDACLLHEGARVLRGVKYVLRSDVVFRE